MGHASATKAFDRVCEVLPEQYGMPVPRYISLSPAVDYDYPDYGLPSVLAYASSSAPWVFMGVDLTAPFRPDTFPLPVTYRRNARLKHYLSYSRYITRHAGNTFPEHLEDLHSILVSLLRRCNRRRTRRYWEAKQEPGSYNLSTDDIVRSLGVHMLRQYTPSNDREMLFFLWDAPLNTYQEQKLDVATTHECLASFGWEPTTSIITGAEAHRMRPMTRQYVFNPQYWSDLREHLRSNLAPLLLGPVLTSTVSAVVSNATPTITPAPVVATTAASLVTPAPVVPTTPAPAVTTTTAPVVTSAAASRVTSTLAPAVAPTPIVATTAAPVVTSAAASRVTSTLAPAVAPTPVVTAVPVVTSAVASENTFIDAPVVSVAPTAVSAGKQSVVSHSAMDVDETLSTPAVKAAVSLADMQAVPSDDLMDLDETQHTSAVRSDVPPRPLFQYRPGVIPGRTVLVSTTRFKDTAREWQEWVPHTVLLTSNGTLKPGTPLGNSDRVWVGPKPPRPERFISVRYNSWDLIDPRTGTYLPRVVDQTIYMMRTRLPVEIQLIILALACDSHASFLKMNDVFRGNLMTPANRNAIGPVFFDPAWTRREVGARHALPQSGQPKRELERVRIIRYSLILPSHFIGVKAALRMWRQAQWINSSSAAVEVLGGQLLDLWNQGRWATPNGTPIRRLFEEASELLGYLGNMRLLEKLDLRMGVWMMYKSWTGEGQYFDQEWLYGLVGRNVRLTKLSIALDMRRWVGDEDHEPPRFQFQRLVGADDERDPYGNLLPVDRPRTKRASLTFCRVIMPDALVSFHEEETWPCFGDLTTFILGCSTLSSTVNSASLAYIIAKRFQATLQTFGLIVCDDHLSIVTESAASPGYQPGQSVSRYSDDESGSEDEYQFAQVVPLADVRESPDDEFDPSPRTEKQSEAPQDPPPGPPPTPLRDLFDRCDSNIKLEHLREFHYEGRWLPYHVLQKFKMPIVELFVLRWRGEMPFYSAGDGPLPFPFRTVKHGSIGPFKTKDLAIEAYRSITGHVDLGLLVNGDVVLFNMQGEPFRDYLYSKPRKGPTFSNAGRTSQPSDSGGPQRTSRGHNRSQKPYSGDGVNRNTLHQDRPSDSSRSYENSSPSQSRGPERASDNGWGGASGRHRDYVQGHAGGSSYVAGHQESGSRDTRDNLGQSHAGGSSYWGGRYGSDERDTRGNPVPRRYDDRTGHSGSSYYHNSNPSKSHGRSR